MAGYEPSPVDPDYDPTKTSVLKYVDPYFDEYKEGDKRGCIMKTIVTLPQIKHMNHILERLEGSRQQIWFEAGQVYGGDDNFVHMDRKMPQEERERSVTLYI